MSGVDPSFAVIVPTAYGQMIVNRHDINQTNTLFKHGVAIDHAEIAMLGRMLAGLGMERTILDIGANFGTYTLAFSSIAGFQGKIHAFEPQRMIFNMLAGSVALNARLNVFCHNVAVGEREGMIEVPQFDYFKPLNFGSIEFGNIQTEKLTQERGFDPQKIEHVPLRTIDSFNFDQVSLMKIDVEGMEMQVVRGAEQTIARCRPVLFAEFIKSDRRALLQQIAALRYAVHPVNGNYLCIPNELSGKIQVKLGP